MQLLWLIINDILYMWLFSLDVIFTHRHLQTVSPADIEGKRGEHFSVYSIMLRYISIKKWLTDFWWLTVVTISILKGLIWEQKYLQQKDYYTSCKSFSIRFWKVVYSISLFTFIVNYTCTSCPLTTQYFMFICEIYMMILTQGWQNQSLGLALDM